MKLSRSILVMVTTLAVMAGTLLLRGRSEVGEADLAAIRAPRVPPVIAHRPSPIPDRIILTWKGDPARTQAVTWRTDATVGAACAELGPCEGSGAFAGVGRNKPKPRTTRWPAQTTRVATDLNEAMYHSVQFDGLEPDTKYLYRVGDGTNWSEWLEFRTASAQAEPFSFIYFGDAQNDLKSHWSRVIRRAFRDAPDARFLIHAGDLINSSNSDADWGEWFRAGGWVNGSIPSMPSPGNHEWFNVNARPVKKAPDGKEIKDPSAPPYLGSISRHWRPQFALPENGPPGQEELTYWFDYQGVRFVSLNSNERQSKSDADKKAQAEWLDGVLTNNPNRWTILTFHHPMFSPAAKRDNPTLRKFWQPIIDKHGVDLVLTGHDHTYARSGLIGGENAVSGGHLRPGKGTVYCVSVSGPKMYELTRKDWMVSTAMGTQLYQIIRVEGDRLHYEARTAAGDVHDLFELRKWNDGTTQLVERDELEREERRTNGPSVGAFTVIPVAIMGSMVALALARRRRRGLAG